MPDRGDERGRGGTRTLVTGILAGTEWLPATNPQEATQTARDARDLAVRLRPVLSKLAQAPRGGRRRDLEWLPAVEQLAVDAQYFASWWLPRLEGKSAQSWPSWSADGYADWVKRLDAQRLRTLEMVEGTAPVTRIASVTQLRRGKNATAEAETEAAAAAVAPESLENLGNLERPERPEHPESPAPPAPGVESGTESHSPARHARGASGGDEERSARITPLRGPGAALMDAAFMDMAEQNRSADETHIARATPTSAPDTRVPAEPELPPVPRTPPNQGPVTDDPDTTHVQRPPADSRPLGFDDLASAASGASEVSDAAPPRVPRTPPNQGPQDAGTGVGADILQIPRTPPNSGPADADGGADVPRTPRAPIVSLVGDDDGPRVPRTPPNPGPAVAEDDADATHISLAPVVPAAKSPAAMGPVAQSQAAKNPDAKTPDAKTPGATSPAAKTPAAPAARAMPAMPTTPATPTAPAALATGAEEQTRPLFRPERPATPPPSVSAAPAPAAAALASASAGAAGASTAAGSGRGSSVGLGLFGGDDSHDEFEDFQPGDDRPPPVFPMTEPVEPVDRGRIVRFAAAAVVLAALCVVAFVALTQKSSNTKTAATTTPSTSSSSPAASASSSGSSSSANPGAVTAPTATDTPPASSSAPKPPPSSAPKPSTPPSTAPQSTSAPHSSAAPPPPPQSTRQQPPAGGGVRALSVSLAPDATGSFTYVAHVHVTTSGTGSVTVTVTFAGTSSSGSPGSTGAQSQSFTLSGKTSYDIDPELDVHGMCTGSGEQPYIDAVASASGASSSVAYASSPC